MKCVFRVSISKGEQCLDILFENQFSMNPIELYRFPNRTVKMPTNYCVYVSIECVLCICFLYSQMASEWTNGWMNEWIKINNNDNNKKNETIFDVSSNKLNIVLLYCYMNWTIFVKGHAIQDDATCEFSSCISSLFYFGIAMHLKVYVWCTCWVGIKFFSLSFDAIVRIK